MKGKAKRISGAREAQKAREGQGRKQEAERKKTWLVSKRSPSLSSPGRSSASLILLSPFLFSGLPLSNCACLAGLYNVYLFLLVFISFSGFSRLQEKRRMDSHETNLTGDDEIIVTKTIRSVSGRFVSVD